MEEEVKMTRTQIWELALELRRNRPEYLPLSEVVDEIKRAIDDINRA